METKDFLPEHLRRRLLERYRASHPPGEPQYFSEAYFFVVDVAIHCATMLPWSEM